MGVQDRHQCLPQLHTEPSARKGAVCPSSSAIAVSLYAGIGQYIFRIDNPLLGEGHNITGEVTVKPTDRLRFTLDYARSRLSGADGGTLFFDGYIARLASVYQFSEMIFVRVIGQYNEFSKGVEIESLFSFKLNPFTIFYAGSTHSLTDFGHFDGIVQTGRQFFLKLQYLWRE